MMRNTRQEDIRHSLLVMIGGNLGFALVALLFYYLYVLVLPYLIPLVWATLCSIALFSTKTAIVLWIQRESGACYTTDGQFAGVFTPSGHLSRSLLQLPMRFMMSSIRGTLEDGGKRFASVVSFLFRVTVGLLLSLIPSSRKPTSSSAGLPGSSAAEDAQLQQTLSALSREELEGESLNESSRTDFSDGSHPYLLPSFFGDSLSSSSGSGFLDVTGRSSTTVIPEMDDSNAQSFGDHSERKEEHSSVSSQRERSWSTPPRMVLTDPLLQHSPSQSPIPWGIFPSKEELDWSSHHHHQNHQQHRQQHTGMHSSHSFLFHPHNFLTPNWTGRKRRALAVPVALRNFSPGAPGEEDGVEDLLSPIPLEISHHTHYTSAHRDTSLLSASNYSVVDEVAEDDDDDEAHGAHDDADDYDEDEGHSDEEEESDHSHTLSEMKHHSDEENEARVGDIRKDDGGDEDLESRRKADRRAEKNQSLSGGSQTEVHSSPPREQRKSRLKRPSSVLSTSSSVSGAPLRAGFRSRSRNLSSRLPRNRSSQRIAEMFKDESKEVGSRNGVERKVNGMQSRDGESEGAEVKLGLTAQQEQQDSGNMDHIDHRIPLDAGPFHFLQGDGFGGQDGLFEEDSHHTTLGLEGFRSVARGDPLAGPAADQPEVFYTAKPQKRKSLFCGKNPFMVLFFVSEICDSVKEDDSSVGVHRIHMNKWSFLSFSLPPLLFFPFPPSTARLIRPLSAAVTQVRSRLQKHSTDPLGKLSHSFGKLESRRSRNQGFNTFNTFSLGEARSSSAVVNPSSSSSSSVSAERIRDRRFRRTGGMESFLRRNQHSPSAAAAAAAGMFRFRAHPGPEGIAPSASLRGGRDDLAEQTTNQQRMGRQRSDDHLLRRTDPKPGRQRNRKPRDIHWRWLGRAYFIYFCYHYPAFFWSSLTYSIVFGAYGNGKIESNAWDRWLYG